jgi:translation initiation factor 3 subunit B
MAKKKDSIDHGSGEGKNGIDMEPDFSDPEGFKDDIKDDELCGDILRTKPRETDGVESVIVVDGLPQVTAERVEKLKAVLRKIFSKFGNIVNEHFAKEDESAKTTYMFIEYSNPTSALEAVKAIDGHKFDKLHTLTVNLFTDFEKYENIPDEWNTPEPQPYKDPGNIWYYIQEPDAFDQYCIVKLGIPKRVHGSDQPIQANDVQIWLNSIPEPQELMNRQGGTETIAKWSPLGTYLATFHGKGVAIWGGEKFEKVNRFAHVNAEFIDFSPCERYLVTFSPKTERFYDNPEVLIIWEIRTGAKKRTFSEIYKSPWPILKWSQDDKYFAKMGPDTLSIYETPSFRLQENKSLKITGIRDFSWSPSDNIIAYWVAEDKDVPARVGLLEIPSRNEIRAKNLFSVADCRMHWQKSGDFLCVKVDRYAKVKKEKNDTKYSGMYYNFELFHMREKEVPVDSVEIKEPISAFSWEPVGSKFAIIHGEQNSICTSFYGVKKGDAPTLLKKFEKKRFNTLFWAPQGQFIILALLKSAEGPLEFVDTSDFSIMNTLMPEMTTDIEWDPTGRYVVAGVSAWTGKVSDTGYSLLSFQGKVVRKERVDRFGNLFWRPRPPCLLTHAQIKEIKKNLKKYSPQFELKDRQRLSKASKEMLTKRQGIVDTWTEYRTKKEEQYVAQKKQRMLLRSNVDTDELDADKNSMHEEVIEVLIKEDSTIVEE